MKWILRICLGLAAAVVALVVGLNIWGMATLGTITPDPSASRDAEANRVVLVSGATGSVGDALLKTAINDPGIETIHVITRRSSPRIDEGVASGKVQMHLLEDFTDYSSLADILPEVNTVLWALGTSSLNVDADTYAWIHVDFPVAFVEAWLSARRQAPMAFHYVTGMGTGEDESARWAQDKGRAERLVAELAEGTGLRTFGHRSGYVRPSAERASWGAYLLEALSKPGDLAIAGTDLGGAMLEISARTEELPNGSIIDNADALAYASIYRANHPR
ncbi:MAG: hypothetical protein V2J89_00770 [Halieaceae bacterium]|jgi:hypothetical protein|nr:hypothetical protein [Halieaceae bacterium]